jgi:hypothetical protein
MHMRPLSLSALDDLSGTCKLVTQENTGGDATACPIMNLKDKMRGNRHENQ